MLSFWEIALIVLIVGFVTLIFGREIYKKVKHKPTGECACCVMQSKRTLRKIRKSIKKQKELSFKA